MALRTSSHEIYSMDRSAFVQVFAAGEYDALLNDLRLGDVVLDCGANIGCFSIAASSHVGSRGRVVAIEPDPENLRALRRNIALNGCSNVTIVDRALNDSTDRTIGLSGRGVAVRVTEHSNSRPVLTITLAAVANRLDLEVIAAIKIDIEDSEKLLFVSPEERLLLRHTRCLVAETHSVESKAHLERVLTEEGFAIRGPLYESAYLWNLARACLIHPITLSVLYGRELPSVARRILRGYVKRRPGVPVTGPLPEFCNIEATKRTS